MAAPAGTHLMEELVMSAIDPWLLVFGAAIALLAILISPAVRMVAVVLVIVGLLVGGYHTFVRSAACSQFGGPCRVPLSPTWAGTCWSSANAAVLKEDGRY